MLILSLLFSIYTLETRLIAIKVIAIHILSLFLYEFVLYSEYFVSMLCSRVINAEYIFFYNTKNNKIASIFHSHEFVYVRINFIKYKYMYCINSVYLYDESTITKKEDKLLSCLSKNNHSSTIIETKMGFLLKLYV